MSLSRSKTVWKCRGGHFYLSMKDKRLEEAMVRVLQQLGLDPETPYHVEPFNAKLWISSMYRVTVENKGSDADISLFVKRFPQDLQRREFFESHMFFRNEMVAYTKILDAFIEFQRERGITEPVQFTPRCYLVECDGKDDIMVLEDLSTQGFSVPSCKKPLTLQDLHLLMHVLGQFHALSLAIKTLQPQRFRDIKSAVNETIWTDGHIEKASGPIFSQAAEEIYTISMQEKDLDSKYVVKLKDLAKNVVRRLQHVCRSDPGNEPWNVVTHGDLWSNNLLLKANGQARFIDLQQCRYGSPALDLSSVLFMSMDGPMRAEHGDALLELYYQSLSQFLQRLGVDPEQVFPFYVIEEQLRKYGFFGMGIGIVNIPHAMQGSSDDLQAEGDSTMTEAVNKERGEISEQCRQRMWDNLRDACDKGYLD
ncbi:uncharacterized protein [Periplaneta americana]|uniref:uncharacterized protein n=1 Tax=Periplaneta americana TaxID=6978 RepID=UPI0037E82155